VALNGFEGGQMPIYRRLPKRGFSNAMFAKNYSVVSLGRIQAAIDAGKLDAKATVDAAVLIAAGLVRRKKDGVRIVSDGDIKAKITLVVAGVTKPAAEKLQKAGCTFTIAGAIAGDVPFVDNIVLIDGIGSKTAKALTAAGCGTLTALVKMDDAALAKICKDTGLGSSWKSQEWKVQAQEMIDGKPPRVQVDKDLAHKLAAKSGK
jgi:large subunit ribosomal protein L15